MAISALNFKTCTARVFNKLVTKDPGTFYVVTPDINTNDLAGFTEMQAATLYKGNTIIEDSNVIFVRDFNLPTHISEDSNIIYYRHHCMEHHAQSLTSALTGTPGQKLYILFIDSSSESETYGQIVDAFMYIWQAEIEAPAMTYFTGEVDNTKTTGSKFVYEIDTATGEETESYITEPYTNSINGAWNVIDIIDYTQPAPITTTDTAEADIEPGQVTVINSDGLATSKLVCRLTSPAIDYILKVEINNINTENLIQENLVTNEPLEHAILLHKYIKHGSVSIVTNKGKEYTDATKELNELGQGFLTLGAASSQKPLIDYSTGEILNLALDADETAEVSYIYYDAMALNILEAGSNPDIFTLYTGKSINPKSVLEADHDVLTSEGCWIGFCIKNDTTDLYKIINKFNSDIIETKNAIISNKDMISHIRRIYQDTKIVYKTMEPELDEHDDPVIDPSTGRPKLQEKAKVIIDGTDGQVTIGGEYLPELYIEGESLTDGTANFNFPPNKDSIRINVERVGHNPFEIKDDGNGILRESTEPTITWGTVNYNTGVIEGRLKAAIDNQNLEYIQNEPVIAGKLGHKPDLLKEVRLTEPYRNIDRDNSHYVKFKSDSGSIINTTELEFNPQTNKFVGTVHFDSDFYGARIQSSKDVTLFRIENNTISKTIGIYKVSNAIDSWIPTGQVLIAGDYRVEISAITYSNQDLDALFYLKTDGTIIIYNSVAIPNSFDGYIANYFTKDKYLKVTASYSYIGTDDISEVLYFRTRATATDFYNNKTVIDTEGNITTQGDIKSDNHLPNINEAYNIGSEDNRWRGLYSKTVDANGSVKTPEIYTGTDELNIDANNKLTVKAENIEYTTLNGETRLYVASANNTGFYVNSNNSEALLQINNTNDKSIESVTHLPNDDSMYDLGSNDKRWKDTYADTAHSTKVHTDILESDNSEDESIRVNATLKTQSIEPQPSDTNTENPAGSEYHIGTSDNSYHAIYGKTLNVDTITSLTSDEPVTIDDNVSITGDTTFSSNINVNQDAAIDGTLTTHSDVSLGGDFLTIIADSVENSEDGSIHIKRQGTDDASAVRYDTLISQVDTIRGNLDDNAIVDTDVVSFTITNTDLSANSDYLEQIITEDLIEYYLKVTPPYNDITVKLSTGEVSNLDIRKYSNLSRYCLSEYLIAFLEEDDTHSITVEYTNRLYNIIEDPDNDTSTNEVTLYGILNYTSSEFKSVDKTFDLLAAKDVIKTQPSISLSLNGTSFEIGSSVDLSCTLNTSRGSYKYNEDGSVSTNGVESNVGITNLSMVFNYMENDSVSLKEIIPSTVTDYSPNKYDYQLVEPCLINAVGTIGEWSASVAFSNGGVAYNNIARPSSIKIEPSIKTISASIQGYRKSWYQCFDTPQDIFSNGTAESNDIRTLLGTGFKTTNTLTISVPDGTKQIVIAIPAVKTVTKITDSNANGMQDWYVSSATSEFTTEVGGADATSETIGSYSTDYNIIVITDNTATGLSANTFTVTLQ